MKNCKEYKSKEANACYSKIKKEKKEKYFFDSDYKWLTLMFLEFVQYTMKLSTLCLLVK